MTTVTGSPVRAERERKLARWPHLLGEGFFGGPMSDWMDRMHGEMERMIKPLPSLEVKPLETWMPRVDVRENEKEYIVTAELPGVDPKDVTVEYTEEKIRIFAKIEGETEETKGGEKNGEEAGEAYLRRERHYGTFERIFTVPEGVSLDKAASTFKNGLLELHLPKIEKEEPKTKTIPIKVK